MGLSIHTTNIRLGMETSPASLELETRTARLELHQKQAKVNITTEKPKVFIDQYECFAEAGLKGNYDFAKEAAQLGYQQAMEFIGKTAEDGYALAAIEKGGNPIAEIAARDAFPQKEFGLAFIPQSRPKIEVTGNIDIQWERNWEGALSGIEGSYVPGYVRTSFTPAKVNVSVLQYPAVNISYEPDIDVLI